MASFVRGEQIGGAWYSATRLGGELAVVDELVEDLDIVPEHRIVRKHYLEAVELGGLCEPVT